VGLRNIYVKIPNSYSFHASQRAGDSKREETPPSKQASELATISRRRLATEQKRDPVGAHRDGDKPEVPDTGMKLPTRMEQGQTERQVPAPAQVGCSAEFRLEQKEGYGWHALIFDICLKG